jgi:glycerol-3-phosphate acyltransferase PlsY
MDALKGWVAVVPLSIWVPLLLGMASDGPSREILQIIGGICAILGHNYTCWLYFKGGKGIATSAGVLLALVPWALLIILAVWVVVIAATRYVSLGSIVASSALPFASWLTHESLIKILVTAAMAALAIYKHKANIQRLLQGTESRLASKHREGTK